MSTIFIFFLELLLQSSLMIDMIKIIPCFILSKCKLQLILRSFVYSQGHICNQNFRTNTIDNSLWHYFWVSRQDWIEIFIICFDDLQNQSYISDLTNFISIGIRIIQWISSWISIFISSLSLNFFIRR